MVAYLMILTFLFNSRHLLGPLLGEVQGAKIDTPLRHYMHLEYTH